MDIQGHRGCRGLFPENSIPGFIHALNLGVDTLEMDAVVSKDGLAIISHEPFMSHEISKTPQGELVIAGAEKNHNISKLTYEEIKRYDCGSKVHPRFPFQKKLSVFKPSLLDMADSVLEAEADLERDPVRFNIEIKRRPEWDFTHHPPYQEFADIIIADIYKAGIMERTTVQCFDVSTLQYLHRKYADVRLVYLVENDNPPMRNMEILGFSPAIYSPDYSLVNESLVTFCKKNNMKLIPWTVNEKQNIKRIIELGVTGIISDYPDVVLNLMDAID